KPASPWAQQRAFRLFLLNRQGWKPSAIGFVRIATRGSVDWNKASNASGNWNLQFTRGCTCRCGLNSLPAMGRCSESHLAQKTLSRPKAWLPNTARLYIKDASVPQTLRLFVRCAAAEPYSSVRLLQPPSRTARRDPREIRATWITRLGEARAVRRP